MRYADLKRKAEAPEHGQMLAYMRKQVIFKPYSNQSEVGLELEDSDILELHLFDEEKEYRAIASRSPRFQDGVIETVADFAEEEENKIYRESVVTEKEFGAVITILNHIHYDEKNGMADIDNYRLRMGEESDGQ